MMSKDKYVRTYNSWRSMRARCLNKNFMYYHKYGGAGITVCDRWKYFANFLEDMGERPDGTSIDRIDNKGNYEPNNCRWADRITQRRNSSYMRMITFNDETLCMRDWANRIGVDERTIYARLSVYKWPIERALTVMP